MRVSIFRYVSTGKRSILPYGGGEKTKQMGLDDCSVDVVESELIDFLFKHNVTVSSNVCAPDQGTHVRSISSALATKKDFLSELRDWFAGEASKVPGRNSEDHFFDIYILFYTGSGTEEGDFQLPQPQVQNQITQHGGQRKKQDQGGNQNTVSLLDIEMTWDDFKKQNFNQMTYDQYRKKYYSNRKPDGGVSSRASQMAMSAASGGGATSSSSAFAGSRTTSQDLNSPQLAAVNPLLWIITDADYSNQWVDQAYAKNYRDIVIQGSSDEVACPVDIFTKTWIQLQSGIIDSRQFILILKTFGGVNCNPKNYTMPGFKFPSWSRPKFSDLLELLNSSRFSATAEGSQTQMNRKRSWVFERKSLKKDSLGVDVAESPGGNRATSGRASIAGRKKDVGTPLAAVSKDQMLSLNPIHLIQGRKQVLSAHFSTLQREVEETLQELEALCWLYADNDTRPGKDNQNNMLTLQDMQNSFSAEKLVYLMHTIKIYIYNPNVCFKALKCLWALTYDEDVRNELITGTVVQIIVKITDIHISDPTICLYATGVISRCAWNMKIWRGSSKVLTTVWNLLIEFMLLHPGEEELIRLIGVTISALAVEKGPGAFTLIFPILCDLTELYIDSVTTVYAIVGSILQLISVRVPEDSEDCLRVFALFMQTLERHGTDSSIHRQCALGMLKLTTSGRSKDVFSSNPGIVNLWISLMAQALETFLESDPYVVWQFISCLLNLIKSHGHLIKPLLFTHPKARHIYRNATVFVSKSGGDSYGEVLKQQVKEFIDMFQSEKQLVRQLIINEKKKEKL